ncbi:MAG: hypothetical protein IJT16_04870 [Lachnospiraceae bacterium]|nr:hypothetical protein [Lachnospiraceae bacterium]
MFRLIENRDVMTEEQMEQRFRGLIFLYIVKDGEDLKYSGIPIAVSDYADIPELKLYEKKCREEGETVAIGFSDDSNVTLTVERFEAM